MKDIEAPPFRFDVAFGPGEAFSCDFHNPKCHLSSKLPDDLKNILRSWSDRSDTVQPAAGTKPDKANSGVLTNGAGVPSDATVASDVQPDAAAKGGAADQETVTPISPSYPEIYSLAFGSRGNEAALIFKDRADWFIGKIARGCCNYD
jgi:hypothetical protein